MQQNLNCTMMDRVAHIFRYVSGEMNHKRYSLGSALWPHSPCFLLNCFLTTAAEMSMADALRCWQDIPHFWRTGMFYPFPITHVESLILNWKCTWNPGTHRLRKFHKHQQMGKTFNSTNLCIQKSSLLGGLCSEGGPPWHVMSVDCVQCEYQL